LCALLFVLHWIFECLRWQMVFSYLVFFLSSLFILKSSISSLFIRLLGFTTGLLLIITSLFYSATMPIKHLPVPSGAYRVGTTHFILTDTSRPELLSSNTDDFRSLFVEVWYPAKAVETSDRPSPNPLWQELYRGDTDQVSTFFSYLKSVNTNSYPDVSPSVEDAPFPLILFNHGLQMFTSQNTILMEHLASHGYVVVSIGHPYESLRVNLDNEQVVLPEFISSLDKFREAMHWIEVNSAPVLAARDAILKLDSPQDRSKIMLDVINQSGMNDVVSRWEMDNRFVLDQLLNSAKQLHLFQNVMDTTRIGVMGMSIGGATATELSKADHRIKAGINIDGLQYGSKNHLGLTIPFMMIYSMEGANSNEFLRLSSKNDFHEYTFLNTKHADFSDMIYIWPVLRIYGQSGQIPSERMLYLTNAVVLNFWDHYFKNHPLKTFDRGDYPELEISQQIQQ